MHKKLRTYHLFLCDFVKKNLLIAEIEREIIFIVHEFEYSLKEGVRLKVKQLYKDNLVWEQEWSPLPLQHRDTEHKGKSLCGRASHAPSP